MFSPQKEGGGGGMSGSQPEGAVEEG